MPTADASLAPAPIDQIGLSCTDLGRDVWMAFFRDPSGNLLALKSDVPASA